MTEYLVLFLVIVLPTALMLAVLIGVPVFVIKRVRRYETIKGKWLAAIIGILALPILIVLVQTVNTLLFKSTAAVIPPPTNTTTVRQLRMPVEFYPDGTIKTQITAATATFSGSNVVTATGVVISYYSSEGVTTSTVQTNTAGLNRIIQMQLKTPPAPPGSSKDEQKEVE